MKKYFDQKFWKMFSWFATIVTISLCIVALVMAYEKKQIEENIITDNLARTTQ